MTGGKRTPEARWGTKVRHRGLRTYSTHTANTKVGLHEESYYLWVLVDLLTIHTT